MEMEALRRELLAISRRLVTFLPQVPDSIVDMLQKVADPSTLLYMIASNVRLEMDKAQEILSGGDSATQMRTLLSVFEKIALGFPPKKGGKP